MNTPKISKGTWIRTIVLIVTLLNTVLVMFGQASLNIDEAQVDAAVNAVYAAVSAVAVVVAAIIAWWKDNDFTQRARRNKKTHKK
jgi:SPP1 family holin